MRIIIIMLYPTFYLFHMYVCIHVPTLSDLQQQCILSDKQYWDLVVESESEKCDQCITYM